MRPVPVERVRLDRATRVELGGQPVDRRRVAGKLVGWTLAGTIALMISSASTASAQAKRVSIAMALDSAHQLNGARKPVVYLRNLLNDSTWIQQLENSLPLIVSYHLETWRSRDGWIDEYVTAVEWQTIITKEPLQEEYAVTLVTGPRPERPRRFAVRDSAQLYLQLPQRIEIFPTRQGRFYYTITLRVTALSDRDMDQLERFLAGDPDLEVPERGTLLGRGLRRLLLRIAGLPSEVLIARSEVFEVRGGQQ